MLATTPHRLVPPAARAVSEAAARWPRRPLLRAPSQSAAARSGPSSRRGAAEVEGSGRAAVGGRKKEYGRRDSNSRPSACEADVITNYTTPALASEARIDSIHSAKCAQMQQRGFHGVPGTHGSGQWRPRMRGCPNPRLVPTCCLRAGFQQEETGRCLGCAGRLSEAEHQQPTGVGVRRGLEEAWDAHVEHRSARENREKCG